MVTIAVRDPRGRMSARNRQQYLRHRLEREKLGYIDALAFVLRAAAARKTETAIAALEHASEAAEAANMAHRVGPPRYPLGELLGEAAGAPLRQCAEAALRTEAVVNVPRFVRMLAPGFYGSPSQAR